MSKKFLAKIVLASVLAGGMNFLPAPNFEIGNFQVSVAHAATMQFSQPVEIGTIVYPPSKGINITNATYNTGKNIGKNLYENGVARWGDSKTGLYFYYDKYPAHFGGKDKNFSVNVMVAISINKIDNNKNFTLYLLQNDGNASFARSYILIGRLPDGKWVKFFDTTEIKKQYLGNTRDGLTNAYCKDDKIIIGYNNGDYRAPDKGEFRFKWDEAAQWFSVEQIKY